MKSKLTSIIAIALLVIAIAFTPFNSVLAGTVKSNTVDTAREAATEVVKDTGAKEQFGKNENGDLLIDKAKARASQKLGNLADEANSDQELPNSKKLFLDNLQDRS